MSCSCDKYPNCPCGQSFSPTTTVKEQHAQVKNIKASAFDEKIIEVTDYYAKLRKKFIHMKQDRIIRKVVEHFHLNR
jgi:hypothetical protein